jgi:hypothetical protein
MTPRARESSAVKGCHGSNVTSRTILIVDARAALTIADILMAQHSRQMGVNIAAAGR